VPELIAALKLKREKCLGLNRFKKNKNFLEMSAGKRRVL
jgi:hypothetical protein